MFERENRTKGLSLLKKSIGKLSWNNGSSQYLDFVDAYMTLFVRIHQNIHVKCIHLIVCKLHFHKLG